MASIRFAKYSTLLALAAFCTSALAALPYNPTTAYSPANSSLVYILRPTQDASNFELVTLDTSQPVSTDFLSFSATSSSLPFSADANTAFTTIGDVGGALHVLAGLCGKGAQGTHLWTFNASADGSNGAWKEQKVAVKDIANPAVNGGSNFLAAGVPFATTAGDVADLFVFGGLCPNSTTLTVDTWQSASSYFNSLLELQRDESTGAYGLSMPYNRGPPIAEAGFTLTPLQPTFFSSTFGNSQAAQQQNFILIGGQTEQAFTNMSQLALLSLPEQTWSYNTVQPPSNPKAKLKARDAGTIDSRSGHAAVLAADGKSIIVVGGWVGDVNTPAEPQVAVLRLGSGYGGSGSWQWATPDLTGPGLPAGGGIYGHGVALLPGNVLMITGGFAIASSPSRKAKRDTMPSPNTATYFFNATANSWTSTYTNPSPRPSGTGIGSGSFNLPASADDSKQRVGLGAGLGLGLGALLGVALFYFWYRRRLRRKRHARVLDPHDLAASRGLHSSDYGDDAGAYVDTPPGTRAGLGAAAGTEMTLRPGAVNPYPWAPAPGAEGALVSARPPPGSEAERTGLLIEVPSPTRGLRRSLYSRPASYHCDPDGRRSRGSGHIHPIEEERDEDEDAAADVRGAQGAEHGDEHAPEPTRPGARGGGGDIVSSAPQLDPFRDPTPSSDHPQDRHLLDGSRSPSPPSPAARAREREVQTWIRDWTAAADNLMQPHPGGPPGGRVSPDRSDRTSSTLSDRSAYSARSVQSNRSGGNGGAGAAGGVHRTASQRSAYLLAASARGGDAESRWRAAHRRSRSLTLGAESTAANAVAEGAATNADGTAANNAGGFARLQAEGRTLLGGVDAAPSGSTSSGSPPRHGLGRGWGWMGSVRRALRTMATGTAAAAPEEPAPAVPPLPDRPMVQRSVSAGAMVWRRRQGARDWDAHSDRRRSMTESAMAGRRAEGGSGGSVPDLRPPPPTTPGEGGEGSGDDDAEWDVESAVERRVVQVMFTVPKEKLRVVNAGPVDEDDEDGGGEQEEPRRGEGGSEGQEDDGGVEKEQKEEW